MVAQRLHLCPSAVTAFIAATATKVAAYAFLRFVFTIFGADFAFGTMHLDVLLLPLALLGIFIASAVAIYQTDLKRAFGLFKRGADRLCNARH